jgi:hypothetical protein
METGDFSFFKEETPVIIRMLDKDKKLIGLSGNIELFQDNGRLIISGIIDKNEKEIS